jgi:AcrR family transcriptional regulator
MLSTRPLEKVAIDAIAAAAGISRGLLFHYFPTKGDFHLAVARAAADDLLARTEVGDDLPPLERLRAGVEAFVDHVAANRDAYVAFIRGSAGGDPALLEVYEATRSAFTGRVLDGIVASGTAPHRLRVAVRGWVAFTEEVTVDWLSQPAMARDEVIDLVDDALVALVTMVLGAWPPPEG